MKWVEIINLRSSGSLQAEIVDEVLLGIGDSDCSIDPRSHLLEVKTYYQPLVKTDLSVHIYWESEAASQYRSPLAVRIYAALMSVGLLDYSVWIERSGQTFSHRPSE